MKLATCDNCKKAIYWLDDQLNTKPYWVHVGSNERIIYCSGLVAEPKEGTEIER